MNWNRALRLTGVVCLLAGSLAAEEFQNAAQYSNKAESFFRAGEYKQAIKFYEKAVKLNTTDPDYRDKLGRAYERQAEQTSFPFALTYKARESFLRAIQLQPDHAGALADLIELIQEPVGLCSGDLKEAHELIERLRVVDPAAAARQNDYWKEANGDDQRLGQRVLCGPVQVSRAVTGRILPHSRLAGPAPAVIAQAPFSNVGTK